MNACNAELFGIIRGLLEENYYHVKTRHLSPPHIIGIREGSTINFKFVDDLRVYVTKHKEIIRRDQGRRVSGWECVWVDNFDLHDPRRMDELTLMVEQDNGY